VQPTPSPLSKGTGDSVTFVGAQSNTATATVGSNATVTYGNTNTSTGFENVTVTTASQTGATSSGTFAMTTLNNVSLIGQSADSITFAHAGPEAMAGADFTASQVNVASVTNTPGATLGQALDLAIGQAANIAAGCKLDWFQFKGDTYVAESYNPTPVPTHNDLAATDAVVKISGLIDLSGSTLDANAHTLTFSSLT
jgi:hypothetical protein